MEIRLTKKQSSWQPRPFVCKKIGQETIKVAHNVAKEALEAHFSFNFAFM